MNKIILLVVIGILNSNLVYSQTDGLKKIEFGINLGTNLSKIRGDNLENSNSKVGMLFGLNLEYHFSKKMTLKTNLNFERKKIGNIWNAYLGEFSIPTNFDANLDYLVLPVLLKYNFGKSNSYFINGGSFIGYLLKAKSKYTNTFTSPGFDVINDITPIYKKFDIGITLGFGKKIKINNKNFLNIEMRNNLGLTNISEPNNNISKNIKTNSLNLVLTWNFMIKKRLPTINKNNNG